MATVVELQNVADDVGNNTQVIGPIMVPARQVGVENLTIHGDGYFKESIISPFRFAELKDQTNSYKNEVTTRIANSKHVVA